MGVGVLSIGLSGMEASRLGMQVVQHNVANANTAGYSRQTASQATNYAQGTGVGYFGSGTHVVTVKRQYDRFLTDQVNRAQTNLSALTASANQMAVIDQMLADPATGVSPAIQQFFNAAQQVAAYPASIAARQSMVSAAQTMTTRINTMGQRIADLSVQTDLQLRTDATALNAYAQQLSVLNVQINKAASFGHAPNDLLDKRDQLITEMGKIADISTVQVTTEGLSGFGSIQVYLGSGYLLVGDNNAYPVEALPSSQDPARFNLFINGMEVEDGAIRGGSLGGMLSFRSNVLDVSLNSLGQVAYALASTFNAQHENGMDLMGNKVGDGNFEGAFFNFPKTITATSNNPTAPALEITLDNPKLTSETPSGYYQTELSKSDFTLYFDGLSYTLTRKSDGHKWLGDINTINQGLSDPAHAQYVGSQGFELSDPGVVPVGNTYLIRPAATMATNVSVNAQIAADVRLVAAGLVLGAATPASNQGSMSAVVTRMVMNHESLVPFDPSVFTLSLQHVNDDPAYPKGKLEGFAGLAVYVTRPDGTPVSVDGSGVPQPSAPVEYIPGASYAVEDVNGNRMVFTVAGVPKETTDALGNTVYDKIQFNRNDGNPVSVSDSSNMVLLGQLQSSKTIGGAASYTGAYAQMVADVGNQTASFNVTRDAQQALLDMSLANRDAYSGVSLDEEAASLLYYQQMYQANAKAIQAGQKTIDILFSIMN